MIQIDNHNELAVSTLIPYLLEFPQIAKLAEQSGNRYQDIENIAWQLLYNLDYTTANGTWLDYIGRKVGQNRIYTPVPTDAFTFGGSSDEGFGAGRFKGTASIRSTKLARSDSEFRSAIKAKIIQNNTDTSLDELIQACKLLFNAKIVRIAEDYPANLSYIRLYGSSLLEVLDAHALIKNALPAGVGLGTISFHQLFNVFKNDAFITYNTIIPESDNFEISFNIMPDVDTTDITFPIFSQSTTFASELVSLYCYYDSTDGIVFKTSPNVYHDNNIGLTCYNDGSNQLYLDADADVILMGGSLTLNTNTTVIIKRSGNTWSLIVDGTTVDSESSAHKISSGEGTKLFLGTANNEYFNSGSIYNFYLKNNTSNTILINDPLKKNTVGTNNGVRFL